MSNEGRGGGGKGVFLGDFEFGNVAQSGDCGFGARFLASGGVRRILRLAIFGNFGVRFFW